MYSKINGKCKYIMNLMDKVKEAVIVASTTFREDQIHAYHKALEVETNKQACWILELLIQNANIANKNKVPLCDDTGIPHVVVEIGKDASLPVNFIRQIKDGIKKGLNELPGRPMAVKGDEIERIEQKKGLYADPGKVISPSFLIDEMTPEGNPKKVKIHILMLGGGPRD